MLFQPAIIALLLAAGLGFTGLALAAPTAWQLARHWDLASGSRRQLSLERRTYLLSALVRILLAAQVTALLLFVFNADRMAPQFVGAMCAVGTLQANRWGLPALGAQIALFFAASLWLIIDHADREARDYPLVRIKFGLLLGVLLPLTGTVLALQFAYFGGLRADVITSCCGSLFSSNATSVPGELGGLPPLTAMIAFYATLAAVIGASVLHFRRGCCASFVAGTSALAFIAALVGIVSFLSLYIYEHPHHHCPFCLLQAEHGYTGYLLYIPLFAATVCGLGVGALAPFRQVAGLRAVLPALSVRLAGGAALGFGAFATIATVLILRSNLVLLSS